MFKNFRKKQTEVGNLVLTFVVGSPQIQDWGQVHWTGWMLLAGCFLQCLKPQTNRALQTASFFVALDHLYDHLSCYTRIIFQSQKAWILSAMVVPAG
jgi:hypothetical protein